MFKNHDELICVCLGVRRKVIEHAVKESNSINIEEVGEKTEAGINCEACHGEINDIIRNHQN